MQFEKIQLEDDETIVKTVRKHWITLLGSMFGLAVFAFVPVLILIVFSIVNSTYHVLPENTLVALAGQITFYYAVWLLFLWMSVAFTLMNYSLDTWTISNRRIIVIDQQGFFRRHIGTFRLEKLQDVNVDIDGIIPTLFDFGTIEAETASESEGDFRAHYLPHPRELKSDIIAAADKLTQFPSNSGV